MSFRDAPQYDQRHHLNKLKTLTGARVTVVGYGDNTLSFGHQQSVSPTVPHLSKNGSTSISYHGQHRLLSLLANNCYRPFEPHFRRADIKGIFLLQTNCNGNIDILFNLYCGSTLPERKSTQIQVVHVANFDNNSEWCKVAEDHFFKSKSRLYTYFRRRNLFSLHNSYRY